MNRSAFTHHPTRKQLLRGVYFHSIHTRALWDRVWAAARAQDWYEPEIGMVANDGEHFYFQIRGLTTGFARVTLPRD